MPVADPGSGRACIWLISCFLFTSLMTGAICLCLYIFHPDYGQDLDLAIVGVILVCLPWAFWILTCCYRVVSRAFGFRIGLGSGPPSSSAAAAKPQGDGNNNGKEAGNQGISDERGSGGSETSVKSHESETPLANAMVQ